MLWNDDYIKLTPDVNAVACAQPSASELWAGPGCGVDGPSVKWNKASSRDQHTLKCFKQNGVVVSLLF